jgi:hypothetical protein
MSLTQRISLIACALLAALVCFVAYGSATQKVETQTEGAAAEQPSFPATVYDDRSELAKGNIGVALDGRAKTTFSYYTVRDSLLYKSTQLSYGGHRVQITATDAAGNTVTRTWTFKVIRR